ncbi:MAG: succinate dehydrogenase [Clostridiales Family XIII bacterium]|jgi:succinate dehydrogenase / fumarate reductase iron-sulfur subunit|nr:succinate dehydrogenase [Clostridiales Family XIII bacterium]
MAFTVKIKRQENAESESYWQSFLCDGNADMSVAAVLNEMNRRVPLIDADGSGADPVAWECGCLVRKCGACAMRINGLPRLACNTFLRDLKDGAATIEPLSKFPLVRDLVVDRGIVFNNLKTLNLWLDGEAHMSDWTHELRYQSAKCLMCGCCLEVCPNFSPGGDFAGAVAAISGFRVFDQSHQSKHLGEVAAAYRKRYFEGCGRSLSCHDICPIGLPVEELMVRSNAAAVWGR